MEVSQLGSLPTGRLQGIAVIDQIVFVTAADPGQVLYIETKARAGELQPSKMLVTDLRKELQARGEGAEGTKTVLAERLKELLNEERAKLLGTEDDAKGQATSRSRIPRGPQPLRPLKLRGDLKALTAPMAIASHPGQRQLCLSDALSNAIVLVDLDPPSGVQLQGKVRLLDRVKLPLTAQINGVCWNPGTDQVLIVDSSADGGIYMVDTDGRGRLLTKVLANRGFEVSGRVLFPPTLSFGPSLQVSAFR